jgi:hypothetical protein
LNNPNLLELAMKASHSKGLKVKPPRDLDSLLEAFLLPYPRHPEVLL